MIFRSEDNESFEFVEEPRKKSKVFLTALEARKLLSQGCTGYLAHLVYKIMEEKLKINDVPLVRYFPEDLPGLLSDREIKFKIDVVLEMEPISKALYMMALAELK